MHLYRAAIGIFFLFDIAVVFAQAPDPIADVRALRLRGALAEARTLAERELGAAPPPLEVALRLELARIHDRIGLHHNTRPVAAALEQIEAAAALAASLDVSSRAQVELARAEYYYRAEMLGRAFATALAHANRAAELFRSLGNSHGEAEAVHRLGLISMQRGELAEARGHFDRSLELDRAGGERAFFRGEYERHVAFVLLMGGNTEDAIPYFERSLALRRSAGAVDASLFAAGSLASALVELGRHDEAKPHLLYALMVAEQIDSPMGKARTGLTLGRYYEGIRDPGGARIAYAFTRDIAAAIGYTSVESQAREALARLQSRREE